MPRSKLPTPMDRLTVMTLSEIAAQLNCTPQAVRHSEKRALEKIRRALIERKIVTPGGRYDADRS